MYGRSKSYGGFYPKPPFNVGDVFEVTVESVGEKGDGVAKKNGFVLFIPNTKRGDAVKVRVTKVFRKFAFAEVVEKVEQQEQVSEEDIKEYNEGQEQEVEDSEDFGEELEATED